VTVRIGIIGVGRWGPNLLRNFHNHRKSEVSIVADHDQRRLAQIAELYPDVKTVPSAHSVFESDVDAVAIVTPTATHHGLVKQALLAGKHVLVEKPIANDLPEAEELGALAADRGLVLLVGHVFLYNPAVERVKEYLDQGLIGKPYYLSMVRTNLGPIRVDVNVAWDLASHDISIANYWLGASPIAASASGGTWINDGIPDAAFIVLRYPNNVLVNLQVSWLSPRKARDITIVAENKMLTLDDTNPQEPIRIYDKGVVDRHVSTDVVDTLGGFRSLVHEGEILIPHVSLGEPLKTECDHFIDCVAHGATPRTPASDAVEVVRALKAIDRSMQNSGGWEAIHSA
jgi:predicted dehydrogenase